MDNTIKTTAAIAVASGTDIQDFFRELADRWRPILRIAGVIAEDHGLPDRACSAGYLSRIGTGHRFAIFEDRGAGSTICQLDAGGAVAAAEEVREDIAAGCDLVVLSKFGRLEASREGAAESVRGGNGRLDPATDVGLAIRCREVEALCRAGIRRAERRRGRGRRMDQGCFAFCLGIRPWFS